MATLEELQENFALFDDWEERYRYLIDLGKELQPMADELKDENTLVKGCTSRVWMVCETSEKGTLNFTADSDAHIVRGLIAIVMAAYNDKTPHQIQAINIDEAFKEIGLDAHLSPNRRNGFYAMVERVRQLSQ